MSIDSAMLEAIVNLRTPLFTELFATITWLGDTLFAAAAILCAIIFFMYRKEVYFAAGIAVATLGGEISTFVFKTLIERVRPPFPVPGLVESSYSFPSGHAMIAVAFYGFLLYAISEQRRWLRQERVSAYVSLVLLIALIGFSRLYLGVHYPSDVLAGYALGALWLWIGVRVSRRVSAISTPIQSQ